MDFQIWYLISNVNATYREVRIMNERLLKSIMALKDISYDDLITQIGISKSAFYRKKKGDSEFTRKEIQIISNCLDLSDEQLSEIFFNHKVA